MHATAALQPARPPPAAAAAAAPADPAWEPMDVDLEDAEEGDDVDFWGGESPGGGGARWFGGDTTAVWDEGYDHGSDSRVITDDELDGMSSHEEEEDDGFVPGSIELIGHR